jgi:hypothetical protein
MEHRGEIIEQAVRNSGLAISKIKTVAKVLKTKTCDFLI